MSRKILGRDRKGLKQRAIYYYPSEKKNGVTEIVYSEINELNGKAEVKDVKRVECFRKPENLSNMDSGMISVFAERIIREDYPFPPQRDFYQEIKIDECLKDAVRKSCNNSDCVCPLFHSFGCWIFSEELDKDMIDTKLISKLLSVARSKTPRTSRTLKRKISERKGTKRRL